MNSPTPAERALARMRRYTTASLCGVAVVFLFVVVTQANNPISAVVMLTVGALVTVHTAFWERQPPVWLSAITVAAAAATWLLSIALRELPGAALLLAATLALLVTLRPRHRGWWTVAAVAIMVAPLVIAAILFPEHNWVPWFTVASMSYAAATGLFLLNAYGWGLYLEIDAARRIGEQLAVAQERYRFAADLHDIQGHTLHVIKLKTTLARRLIDRDPDAAKAQLAEAEELIADTLANTRSLAFGDRHVALASELSNAEELLVAAGIRWSVDGTPSPGEHEELFGLVVRESTTNILRHAQPSQVTITFTPRRMVVSNDGSPEMTRPLSGLARLGERFGAVGGTLRTTARDGVFTTDASLA